MLTVGLLLFTRIEPSGSPELCRRNIAAGDTATRRIEDSAPGRSPALLGKTYHTRPKSAPFLHLG